MSQSASKASFQVLLGSTAGKLLNLVALFLVTPKLGPEGFGQLLIVGIILGVLNLVIDIGFENYYIYKIKLFGPDKTSSEEVKLIEDIVFNMRLYSNIFLLFLQLAISFIGKDRWFSAPIDLYLQILAINYLANIFGRINEVRLKKKMNFKAIAYAKFIGDLGGSIIKVLLVFKGLGIIGWAIGMCVGIFINTIILVFLGSYKPRLITIPAVWRTEVYTFAKHSWLGGFGMFLHTQTSNIILNSLFSLYQIGFIQFSNSYTYEIQSGLISSQMNVFLPYFSNNQHDPDRLRKGVNQYIETSFFIFGLPAIFGIVFGKELIRIFFSDLWLPAYPIFAVYCFYVIARILFTPFLSILTALGKMKESVMVVYINFFLTATVLLVVGFATHNVYIYSAAFVLVSVGTEALKAIMGLRFLKLSIFKVAADCKWNLICLALLFAITWGISFFVPALSLVTIILLFAVLGMVYVGLHFLLNKKLYYIFLQKLKMFLPKRSADFV